ncbi:toluene-4-monooxygenase system B family protein [Streptomyces cavernae]|uniref:toluene-4-monooxygenase system B family protein n=1 Tax=Streptomyces cavernae TaxID=2259034 RepID=UPI000FEBC140|nr:toluene-4-monooxygenase system B family protein [Streptomyces cavernae]
MALFPIIGRVVGGFLPHLVAVDADDTMDEIVEKVAVHSVGRRLPRPSRHVGYDVLLDGEPLPPSATFGLVPAEREVLPLQWFDVRFREEVPTGGFGSPP